MDELKYDLECLRDKLQLERDTLKEQLLLENELYKQHALDLMDEVEAEKNQKIAEIQEIEEIGKRIYIPNLWGRVEEAKVVIEEIDQVKEEITDIIFPHNKADDGRNK